MRRLLNDFNKAVNTGDGETAMTKIKEIRDLTTKTTLTALQCVKIQECEFKLLFALRKFEQAKKVLDDCIKEIEKSTNKDSEPSLKRALASQYRHQCYILLGDFLKIRHPTPSAMQPILSKLKLAIAVHQSAPDKTSPRLDLINDITFLFKLNLMSSKNLFTKCGVDLTKLTHQEEKTLQQNINSTQPHINKNKVSLKRTFIFGAGYESYKIPVKEYRYKHSFAFLGRHEVKEEEKGWKNARKGFKKVTKKDLSVLKLENPFSALSFQK